MTSSVEIVILGAGPAAIATACGLRRLGHEVVLIGNSRNTAVEGMSERTLTLLREHGLRAAAESVRGPGERAGTWAGAELNGSREHVVDRAEFDHALLVDAASGGVTIRKERALGYERVGPMWRVCTDRAQVLCRVVVDARGRRAQRTLRRGPALIAVCQRFRSRQSGKVLTRVEAVPRGWCWLATSRGMTWLQVTSSPKEPSLRSGLQRHLGQFLAAARQTAAALSDATPVGAPLVRAATATLCASPDMPGAFAAGDALLALDPLSGQGMYEGLRSAHVATAAAHTFLSTGEWAPIERFIGERLQELWQRRNTTAAMHYREQAEITPSSFWRQAASHYDSIQLPRSVDPSGARIEWRPVLDGTLIQLRRVVVTPQSPRGIWQVEAVDLPQLMDFLGPARMDVERAAQHLSRPPVAIAHALRWLSAHGLCGSEGTRAPEKPGAGERLHIRTHMS
jgi:flavin-dependent dehydrogenase